MLNDLFNLPKKTLRRMTYAFFIMLNIMLIGIAWRVVDGIKLRQTTEQQAVLNVAVIHAQHGPQSEEIVLPGNVQAWHEATIYARTNGYIEEWFTDIGAKVKKNDLLAKIASPEIDAQLLQAQADLKTAEANHALALTTNERWQNLLKTESVSQQDADEKASNLAATAAIVEAARANVERLQELVSFQRVVAPFDGVITSRTIDVGSLINEGSSNTLRPLFYIVQSDKLRVYVRVPQYYAPRLSKGMEVKLSFTELPGKYFPAKLLSTAEGIDYSTRTLLTEFMVDNKDQLLLTGSYTQVHLILPIPESIVRLPVNTLLFRAEGLQVASIDKNNRTILKSITVGRDFGDELEIVSGILPNEVIIVNPPDSLTTGEKVNVVSQ